MRQKNSSLTENGQIIIIFALALVGFFSFTALAVDIGKVFNDRRNDQNVADSAALAGGGTAVQYIKWLKPQDFACDTNGWVTSISDGAWVTRPSWLDNTKITAILDAAIASAAGNNKGDLSYGLATQNGVAIACNTDANGSYLDIKVMISGFTNTLFTHFFNGGPIRNTVEAVGRIYPRTVGLNGYGIYAFDSQCSEGILIDGGGNQAINVQVDAGGVFSRSCISSTGHGSMYSATTISCLQGSGGESWCNESDPNFTPRLSNVTTDPWKGQIPIPDCANRTLAPAQTITGAILSPGYYEGGLPGHAELQLLPGLYCIAGDVKLNGGGSLTSIPAGGKDGVTLVFMDGGFSEKGDGHMDIRAASSDITATTVPPNVVPGVAIIFAEGNHSELDLGGNSLSSIIGTVYAPQSRIILGGTGDVPESTQFIGFSFKYHGTEMEHLVYNGDMFYQNPASLSLYK